MSVLEAILAVFMAVGEWIATAITSLLPIFYTAEGGLTILGVLGVAGLAFSVVFLVCSFCARLEGNLSTKYSVNCWKISCRQSASKAI